MLLLTFPFGRGTACTWNSPLYTTAVNMQIGRTA
jgi:hypothetical protein